MKKRPAKQKVIYISAEQVERIQKIQIAIEETPYITANTIAQGLGVVPKTVTRAIEFMRSQMGQHLEYFPKCHGWAYTKKSAPMLAQQATQNDVIAVELLKNATAILKGTPAEEDAKNALAKFETCLSTKLCAYPKGWKNIISFHNTSETRFNGGFFDAAFKAAVFRRQLKMRYRKAGPKTVIEERVIEVLHIAKIDDEWFIFVWDPVIKDMRTFAPARIKSLAETGKTFKRPRNFCIHERLKKSFRVFAGIGDYNVRIEFSPAVADFIREKKWRCQTGLRELENGGVELQLNVSHLAEVSRWIESWGGDAIPTEPFELEKTVACAGARMVQNFAKRHPEEARAIQPTVQAQEPTIADLICHLKQKAPHMSAVEKAEALKLLSA
jgi:predicted DNA-binding transcriptional regulator YafY